MVSRNLKDIVILNIHGVDYCCIINGTTKIDELLKRYDVWNELSDRIKKKKIDSELIYNKTFLKTKIKSYSDEGTNFQDK